MLDRDILAPLSDEVTTIIVGSTYKHYKGGEYVVVAVGRMEAGPNEEVVVYRSVTEGHVWVRPVASFLETVITPSYTGPRFVPLST